MRLLAGGNIFNAEIPLLQIYTSPPATLLCCDDYLAHPQRFGVFVQMNLLWFSHKKMKNKILKKE